MPDINIRNVSDELYREVKIDSARHGVTLRDWCIDAFTDFLAEHAPVKLPPELEEEREKDRLFLEGEKWPKP
jgi:plasmid stability protein